MLQKGAHVMVHASVKYLILILHVMIKVCFRLFSGVIFIFTLNLKKYSENSLVLKMTPNTLFFIYLNLKLSLMTLAIILEKSLKQTKVWDSDHHRRWYVEHYVTQVLFMLRQLADTPYI